MRLGVNVDHAATLRQARKTVYPDPVVIALLSEHAGCDSIVAHLREDRRHIQERDVRLIHSCIKIPFNLEMSVAPDIVDFACDLIPDRATLVPERRQELTTEGGIDLTRHARKIERALRRLNDAGIEVSLFIDPEKRQIARARAMGARHIELNTGSYSEATNDSALRSRFVKVHAAAAYARTVGLTVAAGHGLNYDNVARIAAIGHITELNIGHSIISRSLYLGIVGAVEEMIEHMHKGARKRGI